MNQYRRVERKEKQEFCVFHLFGDMSQVTINLQEVISVLQIKHHLYIDTTAGNNPEQKQNQHGSAGVKTFEKEPGATKEQKTL